MKVLQVITLGHELYGAQKHVLDLAALLRNDKHQVKVVFGTTGALSSELEKRDIAWECLPSLQRAINPIKDLKACAELKLAINKFSPDVVASHSSKAGIIARWVCYRMGIPNTFTAHGWSFEDGVPFVHRLIYKLIEKSVGRISDKIITLSNSGREFAIAEGVAAENKFEMIYNGTADTGSQFARDKQPQFTMAMVAGFRKQKDHETLIRALAKLRERDWQLFLLGDGPLKQNCENLSREFGLAEKIRFEGMVNNVPVYLAKTDLLVLITNWEGLPISTLEGLSFSLPVVASNVSGVSEQVIDGYNGRLVERGNIEQVYSALKEMMDSPDKLKLFGQNSRELFETQFTGSVMYQKTKALYQSLVASDSN